MCGTSLYIALTTPGFTKLNWKAHVAYSEIYDALSILYEVALGYERSEGSEVERWGI